MATTTSTNQTRKNALSSIERLFNRNLGVSATAKNHKLQTLPPAPPAVHKKKSRNATSRKARLAKQQRESQIEAQLNPEEQKRAKLLSRRKNAAVISSWDNAASVEELKEKILQQRLERKKNIALKKPENWYASSKAAWMDRDLTVAVDTKDAKKSWPGLTPGLAPVDYESSDEDEE
jgi:hypothetical protein